MAMSRKAWRLSTGHDCGSGGGGSAAAVSATAAVRSHGVNNGRAFTGNPSNLVCRRALHNTNTRSEASISIITGNACSIWPPSLHVPVERVTVDDLQIPKLLHLVIAEPHAPQRMLVTVEHGTLAHLLIVDVLVPE